ncbi:MAG TPA: DinB family protein [Acidobacteriota bacterium]|nr:DinB family protein [Acidobacteriota bacterium]
MTGNGDAARFAEELLALVKETFEGGEPGKGTGFLENTKADGTGNAGVFATLDGLTAAQASAPTAMGTTIASQAAHLAFHLEVSVRWANGDRGPFDWPGSHRPGVVDEAGWEAARARVRGAYAGIVAHARGAADWDSDAVGGLAAALVHAAYHLGAIRQIRKLAR